MGWFIKTEEEKQLKKQAYKIRVEQLIEKNGGALSSIENSLCLDKEGKLYLFGYCEYNEMMEKLAYIIQYKECYQNRTSIVCSKNDKQMYSDAEWLSRATIMIVGDRNRYLELKAGLNTFGVKLEFINKEKNETESTTRSEDSNAVEG